MKLRKRVRSLRILCEALDGFLLWRYAWEGKWFGLIGRIP